MADPLSLLRTYYVNKMVITERDDTIIFGNVAWPKTVKTNYLTYGSGKDGAPKDYYTLECLLFFLKSVHIPNHPEYVRQAVAQSLPVVRRPDRKDLLAYLNGESAASNNIDKSAPLEIPTKVVKRPAETAAEDATAAKKPKVEDAMVTKIKEQLAAKLDAPKVTSLTVGNIKSLSETMTAEKIAAIKAKRMAKKRTNITKGEVVDMSSVLNELSDDTKVILSRERVYRNRNNILSNTKKIFANNVFAMLNNIKIKEQTKLQQAASGAPTPNTMVRNTPAAAAPMRPPANPVGYNRYDQERFKGNKDTEMFAIDPMKSFHGRAIQSILDGSAAKEAPKAAMPAIQRLPNGMLPVSAAKIPAQRVQQNKRASRTPIIIVPSVNTAMINMYNAKDMLQDFTFVPNDVKRSQGCKRETDILITRFKPDGHSVPYRLVDNPLKLTGADWDRVVAVFISGGQGWQFKGWPYQGGPVEIFSKICGFFVKYDEMKTDEKVANWAVNVIELSKTKRHLDRAAIMRFWELLDKYMVNHKRHLRY